MSKALRFSEEDMVQVVQLEGQYWSEPPTECIGQTGKVVKVKPGIGGFIESGCDYLVAFADDQCLCFADSELAPAAVPPPVDAQADDDELTRLRARVAELEAENIDLKHRIAEMKARAWRVSVGISTIEVDLGKLIRELREPQA
jgi:hypothetical protein